MTTVDDTEEDDIVGMGDERVERVERSRVERP